MDIDQPRTAPAFVRMVNTEQRTLVVDLFAPWCGPCLAMAPALKVFARMHPELRFAQINIDELPGVARAYQVQAIPALLLFQNGKPVLRHRGPLNTAQLEALIRPFTP